MKISVIVPTYGYPDVVATLIQKLDESLKKITSDYEMIFVNDCCPSGSLARLKEQFASFSKLKVISLSRNFGQHYAITAGLDHCTGDWVVVMDCDLQDQPEEIINLYNKAMEGYDLVLACRDERKDGFFKKLGSSLFYRFLSYMTGTKQDARIANFGIYSSKVIKAFLKFREQLRFFPANIRWLGFKSAELSVNHAHRAGDKSTYSLKKLFSLASNVIISFSDKPMYLLVKFGTVISLTSILLAIFFLIYALFGKVTVMGWASIMVSIWFMFGVLILAIGVVGLYVAKAFDEAKSRPIYIVDEILESDLK